MNNVSFNPSLKDIANYLFPIGSLYYTQDSSFNPNTHFGGQWVQIKDKFILACGDTYKINQQGGEATHTLNQSEIPNYKIGFLPTPVPHGHWEYRNFGVISSEVASNGKDTITGTHEKVPTQYGYEIYSNGGDKPHNNMPPYETAYIWKRNA